MQIRLFPKRIFKFLLMMIGLLTALNLMGVGLRFRLQNQLKGAVWLFDVSGDRNIPTWYSSMTLLLCALLILIIGCIHFRQGDRFAKHWLNLSAIFMFLSIDEVAAIHEWSANLVEVPDAGGLLHYSWVVVGMAFVALVALFYLRFLRNLPARTRRLFLLAAAVFVGGALGIEILNATIEYSSSAETLLYAISTAFEELCEMMGVAIFIYALVAYLNELTGSNMIHIQFGKVL